LVLQIDIFNQSVLNVTLIFDVSLENWNNIKW